MAYKLEKISEDIVTAVLGERKRGAPKRSATRDLLMLLLLTGGIGISLSVAPSLIVASGALATLFRKESRSKQFVKSLDYVKGKNLVRVRKSNGEWKFTLTKNGTARAEKYWIQQFALPTEKTWNGVWYVIIFDIPHAQKSKRDALRSFIKRHNCYPLQKSVWLYPFDCREELAETKNLLDLKDQWLQVLVAADIGNDTRARKHFGIASRIKTSAS